MIGMNDFSYIRKEFYEEIISVQYSEEGNQ